MMKDLAPSTRKKAAHFKAIHRVLLADENNRNLQLPPPHAVAITDRQFSDEPGHIPAFFLVKGHVLAANISLAAGPVYRYMPTEGTPTRILHSAKLNALVVAVQRAGKSALLFIDPDTGEDLSKPQDKDGNDVASISGLNGRGQQIFGLYEWLFRSANSTWQFIVVSTTNTLVIVSVEQLLSKPGTTPPVPRRIRFWTRFKLRNFENPVFSVVAEGDSLVFASGCMVQKNVLDMAEKRLKPISHVVLDSEVVSLRLVNGKIYALTSRHSLFILDPRDDQAAAPTGSAVAATSLMQVLHLDTSERWGSHQIELANCSPADLKNIGTKDNVDNDNGDDESDGAKSSTQTDINDQIITLVSDIDCGVFGLWVPRRQPGRELEVVFEAELPYSVRKFRRGLTRPLWTRWRRRSRYGVRLATLDGAEILGVGLDGSLRHFMLVDVPLWRLLRFIHDAAMLSPDFCPMADRIDGLGGRIPAEPSIAAALDRDHFRGDLEEIHPGWMHVDGDLINRVYQASKLEQVIPKSHYGQFKRLLDDIDQGAHTADIEQSDDPEELGDYLEFAYEILEHLFEVPF